MIGGKERMRVRTKGLVKENERKRACENLVFTRIIDRHFFQTALLREPAVVRLAIKSLSCLLGKENIIHIGGKVEERFGYIRGRRVG